MVKIPPDLLKRLEEAAAANSTTVEAEIERRLEASFPKKRGRRANPQVFKDFDYLVDLTILREIAKRPKGKASQTIAHLSKKEPFKSRGDLRSRYYRLKKHLRKFGPASAKLVAAGGELERAKAILVAVEAKLKPIRAKLDAGQELSADEATVYETACAETAFVFAVLDESQAEQKANAAKAEEEAKLKAAGVSPISLETWRTLLRKK